VKTRNRFLNKVLLGWMTLLAALSLVSPVQAQGATDSAGPSDRAELDAFLDAFFADKMEAHHVAGAAVSVVKDGEVFLAKGHGYSDVDNRVPVDPDTTLFRLASVTKLFTWTAMMQLVEQGKLDLDEDVNAYLDFKMPDTYPQPITLRHLMDHTAGFEDRFYDTATSSAEEPVLLGEWLATHIPARVRPPGEFAAYSNYGAGLAGYIVERVSGLSYDNYIEQYILGPLEMAHTTTRQPLPDDLSADMSAGHMCVNGAYQAQDFSWEQSAPAGSAWASATDMAYFMIAHLQHGQYRDDRILKEATAQQMHSQSFAHDARLNGFAHGFFESNQNGQWIIGHGGELANAYSHLAILPEQGIGLFVASNSPGGFHLQTELLNVFLDHYYPMPEGTAPAFQASSAQQLQRFTGEYRSTRSSYTTLEKLKTIFAMAYSIDATDDGTLVFSYPLGYFEPIHFTQIEPLAFQEVDGDDLLLFREDDRGEISHAFLSSMPMQAFEKRSIYDTQAFNMLLLAVINLIFFSALFAAPVAYVIGRIRGDAGGQPPLARLARWLVVILALLSTLEGGAFVWTLFFSIDAFKQGNISWLPLLLIIPILIVLLTLGAVVSTVLAWQRKYWGVAGRVHYALVTLAALAQIWFFYNSNLLGRWL
jgi:CubicO group peptidase (beta-lactamase class C family)